MKKLLIFLLTVTVAAYLAGCSAYDDAEQVSHADLNIPKKDGAYSTAHVNGRDVLCSGDESLSEEDGERTAERFDGILNEYSYLEDGLSRWLFLSDAHNTPIRACRVGNDPYSFYPELPIVLQDGADNIVYILSFDITEGIFQYVCIYDEYNRIVFSQEQCFFPGFTEGSTINRTSIINIEYEYLEDGSYYQTFSYGKIGGEVNTEFRYLFDKGNEKIGREEYVNGEWSGSMK